MTESNRPRLLWLLPPVLLLLCALGCAAYARHAFASADAQKQHLIEAQHFASVLLAAEHVQLTTDLQAHTQAAASAVELPQHVLTSLQMTPVSETTALKIQLSGVTPLQVASLLRELSPPDGPVRVNILELTALPQPSGEDLWQLNLIIDFSRQEDTP